MATWRDAARGVILKALEDARAAGLEPAATLALVDSRYPFGVRDYHPYKMWLSERKRLLTSPQTAQDQAVARGGRPVFGGAIVDTQDYTWAEGGDNAQT
jgi:hypothetical protein